jgi:hypothetical protein
VWVNTPKRLRSMLQQLQGVAWVGLDTEHTGHRSYLGVTCLLQLSTGKTIVTSHMRRCIHARMCCGQEMVCACISVKHASVVLTCY